MRWLTRHEREPGLARGLPRHAAVGSERTVEALTTGNNAGRAEEQGCLRVSRIECPGHG